MKKAPTYLPHLNKILINVILKVGLLDPSNGLATTNSKNLQTIMYNNNAIITMSQNV